MLSSVSSLSCSISSRNIDSDYNESRLTWTRSRSVTTGSFQTRSDMSEMTSYSEYTTTTATTTTDTSEYTATTGAETRCNSEQCYTTTDLYPLTQTPLDPNWTLSSGSSFTDYTDSSVTLPSLQDDDDDDDEAVDVIEDPKVLPSMSLIPQNQVVVKGSVNNGGLISRLKAAAVTFVDKILVEDKINGRSETETMSIGNFSTDTSFKVGSMFSKKSSKDETSGDYASENTNSQKPVDTSTLLGMVKKYEEENRKIANQASSVDIPHLIRVEEGPILYRRESPGAKSARSGKIGNSFRRRLNNDDSSAFSAFSHTSSVGKCSMDEGEESKRPSGSRPSPLGGRDKDLLDMVAIDGHHLINLTDTLEVRFFKFLFPYYIKILGYKIRIALSRVQSNQLVPDS